MAVRHISRWLCALALTGVTLTLVAPAQAQRWQRSPGFFQQLFGPRSFGPVEREAPSEPARPPSSKKLDAAAPAPTTSVMVMGDSMAEWLAYGLEDAFADAPEIGVLRRTKQYSGLIRYESRSDLDWWHVARDLLTKDKVDYVVMMLGVGDRSDIREKDADKGADKAADKKADAPGDQAAKKPDDPDETPSLIAPEPQRGGRGGSIEFRTERWEQIYTKRIDDTIAALKSKGVPVLWVGLPSIRGTRSTADAVYLNDLFRARAEKAGIVYVDVWDGFVDEGGKFTYFGPDFEGQNRRLRSGDGVNFTKSGSRKLAHYVERELRRFMSNRTLPMALPSDTQQAPSATGPAARPVAGPVVPLTGVASTGGDELLGGNSSRPALSDPVATSVLVKGEPVAPAPGRADDFKWPRGGDAASAEPLSPAAAAARDVPAANAKAPPPAAAKPKPSQASTAPAAKDETKDTPKTQVDRPVANKPAADKAQAKAQDQPRVDNRSKPPAPVQRQSQPQPQQRGGLFGLFR